MSIGSHIGIQSSLSKSLNYALSLGITSPQFFFGSPYKLQRKQFKAEDLEQCGEISCNCFVHCPYVINFAGVASSNTIAWDGCENTDEKVKECILSVQSDLETCDKLRHCKKGCVVHVGSIGKNKDWEKGCKAVATSINKLVFDSTPLLIETMVGRGGVLGKNFDELALMYNSIQDRDHVGFCLDTCHVFAEGLFDLGTNTGIDECFAEFDSKIGLQYLKAVHLNDSMDGFASKKDHHQGLCKGEIWKNRDKALCYFLQRCKALDLPVILETTPDDIPLLIEYNKES